MNQNSPVILQAGTIKVQVGTAVVQLGTQSAELIKLLLDSFNDRKPMKYKIDFHI